MPGQGAWAPAVTQVTTGARELLVRTLMDLGPARRFGSAALAALGASGLLVGCAGGRIDPTAEVRNGQPLACEGAIDAHGIVLRSEVGKGRLFTSGERLILVESQGRISS